MCAKETCVLKVPLPAQHRAHDEHRTGLYITLINTTENSPTSKARVIQRSNYPKLRLSTVKMFRLDNISIFSK